MLLFMTALRNAPNLSALLLDALEDQAVVLDGSGCIVMANKSWMHFADQNGGDATRVGVGLTT
jgi:hypothetical protein